jgi:hypothetical protein
MDCRKQLIGTRITKTEFRRKDWYSTAYPHTNLIIPPFIHRFFHKNQWTRNPDILMTKVTVFSAPKPFSKPHIKTIQRNAVRSWLALGPEVEVLLIGDEPGIREAALDIGVRQISDVTCNAQGTPLVSSIFELARENSSSDVMIYLNADIILLPECLEVIDSVCAQCKEFLLVGRRWDLDINEALDFERNWIEELNVRLEREGVFRKNTAMDYFIFPRNLLQHIPPFVVGRAGWDNWMIFYGMHQPWPVIDITPSNRIIHQNHDYSHLPNGQIHYDLEESRQNVSLAGGMRSIYDLLDVNLVFRNGRIHNKKPSLRRLLRRLERFVMPERQVGWRWQLTRMFRKIGRRIDRNG